MTRLQMLLALVLGRARAGSKEPRPGPASNLAAVPAPLPMGAAGSHVYVPVQLMSGIQHGQSSAGSLWAWVVAAGGALPGVRQQEPRRRPRHVVGVESWPTAHEEVHEPEVEVNDQNEAANWANPQMMPLVMVAMPYQEEPHEPHYFQPAAPLAPGHLERAPTETSDSSWASASSNSRWSSKDCEWAIRQLQKPEHYDLMQQVIQDAWLLASSKHGTRVVQTALDVAQ